VKLNNNISKSRANAEHIKDSPSYSQNVIAKIEPVEMNNVFNSGDKISRAMANETCDRIALECDLNSTEDVRSIPRPESSGSSEVSILPSDQGFNFAREDETYTYQSYPSSFNSIRNDAERCGIQFPAPENSCHGAMSRIPSERSPNMATNEQMSPWFQDRIDQFPPSSVAPPATNYATIDTSYPISSTTSVENSFRNNSSCDNRLEYVGYNYNQPSATSAYFSAYQHRPAYASYDYPKF